MAIQTTATTANAVPIKPCATKPIKSQTMSDKSTICLNMIVRDEAHVIQRCLKAAKPHITHYCIVDTGSTDRTKEIIREYLKDIPGEVYERPWVNFGHNRTEALQLARKQKTDYILVMDADDVIVGAKPLKLIHDEYMLTIDDSGNTYMRSHIFRANLPYRYIGPVHEYLHCDKPIPPEQRVHLPTLVYRRYIEGARSKEGGDTKYLRDAAVLEAALEKEPDNARYWYYLGQSYKDAGQHAKAIEIFEKRASMGGFAEEAYLALEFIAKLTEELAGEASKETPNETIEKVERAYLRAYEYRPQRLEPIHDVCSYLNRCERFQRSYLLSKSVLDKPIPNDIFLLERSVYEWRMKDIFATAAFYVGDKHGSRRVCEELLMNPRLPITEVARIEQNKLCCAEIGELSFGTRHIEKNHIESSFGGFLDQLKKNIGAGSSELGMELMLFALAVSTRAETIVEIGRYRGASTFALASALKFLKQGWHEAPEAHQRPGIDYERLEKGDIDRKLYSIDAYPLPEATEMIAAHDLTEFVTFINKASQQVEPADIDQKQIDLCFIDGDHSYNACLSDVLRYVPMMKPGSYFILHDFYGWYDAAGNNGSPIKQVCDIIKGDFDHVLIDTSYMSFMLFRKRDKSETIPPKPWVEVPRLRAKHWAPIPAVVAYVEALIQPGWKVLEIGPGHAPFTKATHFVTRPGSGTGTEVDVAREPLPFADKEFDFVYCRHVVEDLVYPDLLLSEMNRIGKTGYIETPSPVVELTRGVDGGDLPKHRGYIHHHWIVWDDQGVLKLVAKASVIEHMELEDHSDSLADPMQWNTYFAWTGGFEFKRYQHEIDFMLQINYDKILAAACKVSFASVEEMKRRLR